MKIYRKTSTRYINMFQTLIALRNTMQWHECNNHDTFRAPINIEHNNSIVFKEVKEKRRKKIVTPEY
jgi:hypothetical protein